MLKRLTQKEVFARDGIHIFTYTTNMGGLKMIEFGALFLLVIAVLVYPFTHFDPPAWIAAPVILAVASIAIFANSMKWRNFARKAFLAYDNEYFIIGNDPQKAVCIPWEKLDVVNTGLNQPKAGSDLMINIDGESVRLILFSSVVCIPQFEHVLHTILTHIKENQEAAKAAAGKD